MAGGRPQELFESLREPLRDALGERGAARLDLLVPPKAVADDPAKLLVRDDAGRRAAVLAFSPEIAPDLVARAQRGARDAHRALGPALGAAVLLPLAEGELEGRSWAVLPWCTPLSRRRLQGWIQRHRLSPALLRWLYDAAEATMATPGAEEIEAGFAAPLRAVLEFPALDASVRAAAQRGLDRLEGGHWKPRFVLAHNDLWSGNVLLRATGPLAGLATPERFAVIDWPASRVRGHPLFDLIRMGRSFGVGPRELGAEVTRHCALLECDPDDAGSHLAAAIGHIALVLEHMPPDLFRNMAATTIETWRQLSAAP